MKKLVFLALLLGLSSCHTERVVTVRETVHDTLRLADVRYDSVYVDRYQEVHTLHDTVFRDRVQTEYRLRLRHDTTYISRRDTVPVTVVVDKPVRYTPFPVRLLAGWGLGNIIALILYLIWKKRRFLRTLV